MAEFEEKDYRIFELFHQQWALVTAGTGERFDACTVGWGSLGTIWTGPGKSGSTVTVYLYPTRYTCELLRSSETFTVSFFPQEYRRELAFLGTHSGRDGDKIAASGLTPVPVGDSIAFEEAELVFVCRKIYQHQLAKEDIAPDVQAYYAANPGVYPVDEAGEWHPHWLFMGEITEVIDRR